MNGKYIFRIETNDGYAVDHRRSLTYAIKSAEANAKRDMMEENTPFCVIRIDSGEIVHRAWNSSTI